MKKARILLAMLILLALAGCAEEGTGLLTLNEIAKYEGLYLQGTDVLWDGLGLTEDDLAYQNIDLWVLKEPRSIGGKDFEQELQLWTLDPSESSGLRCVAFTRRFESDSERAELLRELYDQAVSLYGPPDPQPPRDKYSRVLVQLENEIPGGCFETWDVGEKTMLKLWLFDPSEVDPPVAGVPFIAIRYMTPITE